MALKLTNVTLWACVRSTDVGYYKRTLAVVRYCQRLCQFEHTLLFAYLPLPSGERYDGELVQIPPMDIDQFGIFVNSIVPRFIRSEFALSVHEDGFILDVNRWKPEFMDYDLIGAPWRQDGVVGNGAFCLESQRLLQEKARLPFTQRLTKQYDGQWYYPSDVFVCRFHRKTLESRGIRFAPRNVALQFSTEQISGPHLPSFGFHGQRINNRAYNQAWNGLLMEIGDRR